MSPGDTPLDVRMVSAFLKAVCDVAVCWVILRFAARVTKREWVIAAMFLALGTIMYELGIHRPIWSH